MDTVTILFIYRGSSAPHIVTIDRQYLPLIQAALHHAAPFAISDVDGTESTIHPRALARVMVVATEREG